MYKRPGMMTYTFYYKTTDTMTYVEHFAEYNIDAYNMEEATKVWEEFAHDLRVSSWELVELIRVVPKVAHTEFDKVKWMIEG